MYRPYVFEGESPPRVVQALSQARHAKRLTRRPAYHEVYTAVVLRPIVRRHVADVRHVGIVVRQHGGREGFDFRETYRFPPKRMKCHRCRFDAAEHGNVPQRAFPFRLDLPNRHAPIVTRTVAPWQR